jgi:hypothetical protein
LREEAGDQGRRHDFKKQDAVAFPKYTGNKGTIALPPQQRPGAAPAADDKRAPEDRWPFQRTSTDEKLASMRNYCQERGLCIHYGEKWQQCAANPQLHVFQEVWDLCHNDLSEDGEDCTATTETKEQVFMLLSSIAASGVLAHHTLQLLGQIHDHPITILVDSSSSHSFLSTFFASMLLGVKPMAKMVQVKVADGSSVPCSDEIPLVVWSVPMFSDRIIEASRMTTDQTTNRD